MPSSQERRDIIPRDVEITIPSDEEGRSASWKDSLVPKMKSSKFKDLFSVIWNRITTEERQSLAEGQPSENTVDCIILVCHDFINRYSYSIVDHVRDRFYLGKEHHDDQEHAGNSSNTSIAEYIATEAEIRDSFGDVFDHCFGEAMGVTQERSDASEKLLDLVAAEVTQRVKQSLSRITEGRCSPEESSQAEASHIEDMVQYVLCILSRLIKGHVEAPLTDEVSPNAAADELSEEHKDFLSVFLMKLLDHIAHSTKTSVPDVDFDGMLQRLTETTMGGITPTLSQTVENFHIPIYKKLCRRFGSAKRLQAAVTSSDGAFEEAVAKILVAQLHKVPKNSRSLFSKVRRFSRKRTSKVTPACVTEDTEDETLQSRRKPPAIVRFLSSVGNFLMEPFYSMSGDTLSSGSEIRAQYISLAPRF